jgi:hypothetical protein
MTNKLTEREKWLMNLAYSERGIYDKYTDLLNDDVESFIANEAPKPELIVKTVDPDNLPEGEVLAFGIGEIHCGYLESYRDWVICELEGVCLENVTHYIEQKDLIEVFNNAK